MVSESGGNQSVERASAVLNAFTLGRPALRVSDVAAEVGLGISTTSRLLATLESVELVRRDPVSQLYELGPAVLTMAGIALNNDPIYRQARPVAQRLAWELGLGANVAVRRGAELFYLLNVEGQLAQKSFSLMGQRNPLHATAMGKSLLLGLSPEQRRDLLGPEPLQGFTGHTITTFEALDADLARVTGRGYSTEIEELALGRACIAAPVRDHTGAVVAAISLSGALSAIALDEREADLGRTIVEAADSVSIGLGYLGPAHTPVREVR
ncbi:MULTISPECIES: IclR family transcriptional regulator [Amycolatopsis]|uniref:IclR family transcriptional regulator n=1 Tax=Amycolatopsis thermalba TaxID=944492 RepID=A0ABY4P3P1_9PSEU|nr:MULTISPECIES: IclR family transcriptional regulator [Amycolatopsis]OXM71469.1 IclR family transcriptional regulator [Amycolatopsis sp. KNN50.9b]UQS26828.1 IclR family transcriptional regulator [Amycolatopsis thermalba]